MRKCISNANLVRAIEHLNDKTMSADRMNVSTGGRFRTTVVVSARTLLSHILMRNNVKYFRRISKVSIDGKTNTSLCFIDKINALAEEEQKNKS